MVDPFTGKRWTPAEMFRSSAHRAVENAFWSALRADWDSAYVLLQWALEDVAWCAAHDVRRPRHGVGFRGPDGEIVAGADPKAYPGE
jgi:hypothetical protein